MKTLEVCPLPPGINIIKNDPHTEPKLSMESPALLGMTDLSKQRALTTDPHATIKFVHQYMISAGIRLLLVLGTDKSVIGVITATDLLGPTPIQKCQELGLSCDQLLVEHIMTPSRKMDVVSLQDIQHADVSEIIATLRDVDRQHLIVVDHQSNPPVIRGLFSRTQIERQLGMHLDPNHAKSSLVEIQKEISSV